MKKLYWIIGIGIIIILLVVIIKFMNGNKPFEVYTQNASTRTIIELVSATGKIQPETELKLSSDVSGEITEMVVKEGDQVKKGALLCRIKPDLYVSAIERVNANVNTTKANLKTAMAQLDQAKANLTNSEATYLRNKKLFEQNTISTRNSFLAKVTPYLENIQQKQGLYAFKVVMDESNNGPAVIDQNQLIGQIYVQPTRTAEFISLDFILLPTGAEFPG
jgi:HlyD family secretion protein